MKFTFILLLTVFVCVITSCKKDSLSNNKCGNLMKALSASDVSGVSKSLQSLLTVYSEENLNNMAANISKDCDMTAKLFCFSCISTLPEQSEISVSFQQSGTTVSKVIDISYTPDKKMHIVNVHD